MPDITDEQLAAHKLTREAFDALEDYEKEALTMDDPDGSAVVDDDEGDDDDTPAAAPAPAPAPAAAPAPAPTPAAAPAPAPAAAADDETESREFRYTPQVLDVAPLETQAAEIDQRIKAIDEKLAKLDKDFDDGEIMGADYRVQSRQLQEERRVLDLQHLDVRGEIKLAKREQTRAQSELVQRWDYTREMFMTDDAVAPLYSHATLGEQAKAAFQQFAGMLANEDTQKGQPNAHSFTWYAREAHKRVVAFLSPQMAEAGVALGGVPSAVKPAKPSKPTRNPDLSGVPTTLRGVPNAAADAPAGEFAHLDGLEGEDFTNALAKLTPDQRERYYADV